MFRRREILSVLKDSPGDYRRMDQIWNGAQPGGGTCVVVEGPPEHAGDHVELAGIGSAFAPDYHPAEVFEMAQKLYKKAKS